MRIIRAGEHIQHIPGYGISVRESGVAVAAANWWEVPGKTCVAAYQPKGAASYAASKVNLANPGTYDAAEGVAPTWAAVTGWTFNGSTQYLTTGLLPTYGMTFLVRWSNGSGSGSFMMGANTLTATAHWCGVAWRHPGYGTTMAYANCSVSFTGIGNRSASGVGGCAGKYAYFNGSYVSDVNSYLSGTHTHAFTLGVMNNNGTLAYYFPGTIVAAVFYSDVLTAGEVATVSAAMAAL